jgi:ATP/maltotriose-dependent transcriptional regulator MalT
MKIIIDNKDDVLDNDLWWVVGNWLDRLPEYIQRSNPSLIMARLWVQEFTWDLKDSKALLKILADFPESDWSKRDKAECKFHQSHSALFHSGDPVRAIALAEQSKSLLQDYGMLGGRRELVLAVSRHMIGKTDEALQKLSVFEETLFKTKPIYLRAYVAKMLVLMISGDYQTAKSYSEHFVFLTKDCPFPTVEAYSIYFQANVNYQLWSDEYTLGYLENALQYQGQLNFRGLIDAYAGYVIALALKGDIDAAWASWKLMVSKQKDIKRNLFHAEVISTEIRLRCLLNDAKYCLDWATKSLDSEFTLHDPFVVMEVPYITLIKVFVNFGDHTQIQIGLSLINKLLDKLATLNNRYHHLDLLLLKALAYWRMNNHHDAKEFLHQALDVYSAQGIIRPF